jgi:DNA-directed RNA polymerase specialized sigma24 family protein
VAGDHPVVVTTSREPAATPGLRSDELAASLRTALLRYVRLLGAVPDHADDLVQEAFVIALARADFDARVPGAAFTFLRTTVRHLWLRRFRGRPPVHDVADVDAVWDERCADGGLGYVDALRACVDRLPARSRRLLAATYGAGAGRADAATAFTMSVDGVKSALRRLRAFLHECIARRLRQEDA